MPLPSAGRKAPLVARYARSGMASQSRALATLGLSEKVGARSKKHHRGHRMSRRTHGRMIGLGGGVGTTRRLN